MIPTRARQAEEQRAKCRAEFAAEITRLRAINAELLASLKQMQAFVGVTHGEGPEANIPETVPTRIGVPVKLGAIMRGVNAAITAATKG